MFQWFSSNWTTVLLVLAVLVCPLMHALGGHGIRRRHGASAGTRRA